MPFQQFIDPATGQFYDMERIRDILQKELDPSKETIASCGTGISPISCYLQKALLQAYYISR